MEEEVVEFFLQGSGIRGRAGIALCSLVSHCSASESPGED